MVPGPVSPVDLGSRLPGQFELSRSCATFRLDTVPRDALAQVRAELFPAAIRGELHAVVHEVLPLEQAADTHRKMDKRCVRQCARGSRWRSTAGRHGI